MVLKMYREKSKKRPHAKPHIRVIKVDGGYQFLAGSTVVDKQLNNGVNPKVVGLKVDAPDELQWTQDPEDIDNGITSTLQY
jgi:hypothetical protein